MISRVISTLNGVTPIITLLINDLLSPLPLQVEVPLRLPSGAPLGDLQGLHGLRLGVLGFGVQGFRVWGLRVY